MPSPTAPLGDDFIGGPMWVASLRRLRERLALLPWARAPAHGARVVSRGDEGAEFPVADVVHPFPGAANAVLDYLLGA